MILVSNKHDLERIEAKNKQQLQQHDLFPNYYLIKFKILMYLC